MNFVNKISPNTNFYLNNPKTFIPLPTKKASEYIADVGDSDSEEFDDYNRSEDELDLQIRKFGVDGSVKAEHTTIYANDGRIKGDELIKICHGMVQQACKDEYTVRKFEFDELHSKGFDEDKKIFPKYEFTKKSDWMLNLGMLAKFKPLTEMYTSWNLDKFTIREDGIQLAMSYASTERMSLSEEFIKSWNKSFSTCKFSILDLTYVDINRANQFVIKFLSNIDKKFTDCDLAKIQIQRFKFDKVIWSKELRTFYNESKENKLQMGLIVKYFDFLNALMFGLEASRVNATLITGVMTLELIQAGHLTYKDAFFENANWGGQFPLATFGSGSDNLKARSHLLMAKDAGMAQDRCYPKWLAITCKESIMIKNWFNTKLATSTLNFSKAEISDKFTALIEQLIKEYY